MAATEPFIPPTADYTQSRFLEIAPTEHARPLLSQGTMAIWCWATPVTSISALLLEKAEHYGMSSGAGEGDHNTWKP